MSAFLDNFTPDPEMPDVRRLWRTRKPLFRDAVVAYAPPYPEYPKLKLGKSRRPSNDPSCPSARMPGDEVDVVAYCYHQEAEGLQERAWNFLVDHAATIEARLRRKLLAHHARSMRQFVDEDLPADNRLRKSWKDIEGRVNLRDDSAIDHLFKLVGIGLADSGLDDCGFTSFEFQSGWDRDHGLGILMHRAEVLAAGGMSELIGGGPGIVEGVKCVQAYDLDDGDLSLLDG
ncbi:MAG: hypothetical protein U0790_21525 [Isosphaeraceae bacterium]